MIQRIRRSRMFGWDRNPLRRRIDRVEAVMLSGLIVLFLAAAPVLAAVTGHWTWAAGIRHHSEAAWRQVSATVQRGAAAQRDGSAGPAGTVWVLARWTAPDGTGRPAAQRLGCGQSCGGGGRQHAGLGQSCGLADRTAAAAYAAARLDCVCRSAGAIRGGTHGLALAGRPRRAMPARPAPSRGLGPSMGGSGATVDPAALITSCYPGYAVRPHTGRQHVPVHVIVSAGDFRAAKSRAAGGRPMERPPANARFPLLARGARPLPCLSSLSSFPQTSSPEGPLP
jgi:hypothetical protein